MRHFNLILVRNCPAILKLIPVLLLLSATGKIFAQPPRKIPVRQATASPNTLDVRAFTKTDTAAGSNECIITDEAYNNPANWQWLQQRYFLPAVSGCPTFNPLVAPTPKGTIAVNAGRVNFTNVRGACENRLVRNLGTPLSTGFEVKLDLNVTQPAPGTTGVGIIPLALTSSPFPEISYLDPTNPALCNVRPDMDEIALYVVTTANNPTAPLMLGLQIFDNGNVIAPPAPIAVGNGIPFGSTAYITMRVSAQGNLELKVYSDPLRTRLIRNGSVCFQLPATVNGLVFLQHSTLSGGGLGRITNAWVDNVNICRVAPVCCSVNIQGADFVCSTGNAGNNNIYTLSGDFDFNNASISLTAVPNDVVFTRNGNTITVTNWGTFTSAPKAVTIRVNASSCDCGTVTASKIVSVFPSPDARFEINGTGTSGALLTDFQAMPLFAMPGAVSHWEVFLSDVNGNQFASVRDAEWHNAGTINPFQVRAIGANATHIYAASYPDLLKTNFYLVRHTMTFENGLCDGSQKTGLVYVNTQNKLIYMGDPTEKGFKEKVNKLLQAEKQ